MSDWTLFLICGSVGAAVLDQLDSVMLSGDKTVFLEPAVSAVANLDYAPAAIRNRQWLAVGSNPPASLPIWIQPIDYPGLARLVTTCGRSLTWSG